MQVFLLKSPLTLPAHRVTHLNKLFKPFLNIHFWEFCMSSEIINFRLGEQFKYSFNGWAGIVINCHQLPSTVINCNQLSNVNQFVTFVTFVIFVIFVTFVTFVTFIMFIYDCWWLLMTLWWLMDFRFWSHVRTDRRTKLVIKSLSRLKSSKAYRRNQTKS